MQLFLRKTIKMLILKIVGIYNVNIHDTTYIAMYILIYLSRLIYQRMIASRKTSMVH